MALTLADIQKRSYKSSDTLRSLVLGKRCAGKSYAAGTIGGKALMLAFTDEDHGVSSVEKTMGANVTPVIVNLIPDTKIAGSFKLANPATEGEAVLKNILEILATPGIEQAYGALIFDGHSAFDRYVPSTTAVLTAGQYKESQACVDQHLKVVDALKALAARGMDVVSTCALNAWVNESAETIYEPALRGAKTVAGIVGAYSEVLLVEKKTFDGDDKPSHVFTFNDPGLSVVKTGTKLAFDKDKKPKAGGIRIASVDLRVNGVLTEDLPDHCEAKFGIIRALRKQTKKAQP